MLCINCLQLSSQGEKNNQLAVKNTPKDYGLYKRRTIYGSCRDVNWALLTVKGCNLLTENLCDPQGDYLLVRL